MSVDVKHFREPTSEYGILPFWFLNGELDPQEMRFQLRELRDKGMHGVILHGRYGLEMPYLGDRYLERIKLASDEAAALGLETWVYDEMNWPSGTADKRVLRERPDLAQRYIECVSFTIEGPWFMCLTGEDSRYLDFERSTPVAAFALGPRGEVLDLTSNLSFEKVVPWEVPPGTWRLAYVVEKTADYYIDALDPESTATFLKVGYEPYVRAIGSNGSRLTGFYSDEPAMHYFLTGGDNAVVPWTKGMFRRFFDRNGYQLRPRLADLFFDLRPDSARIRYDFYSTLTEFYSDAYYRQLREWCGQHGLLFTAHLLYEEWLRRMIRVEGNLFKHYANMDVVAVDHLYPVIGTRESPDQHVAMKVASSAAHHFGSRRVICESFGGIFMDATMQRMKWIADWEYVLGVNLLNPHGFHYTLEGARKRDWPPSQFYQYPWWHYYQGFSDYISRLSRLLSGGRHVAKVAVMWPINAMFSTYRPQERDPLGDRIEQDFNALTDILLRLHFDFDYLDEDTLASAEISDGSVRVRDEAYDVVLIPPMTHLKLSTVERLERLVEVGGRVLGTVFLPSEAFGSEGQTDVSSRIEALMGVDPKAALREFPSLTGVETVIRDHAGGGKTAFIRAPAIAQAGGGRGEELTGQHGVGSPGILPALRDALAGFVTPDVEIDNDELFCLHRRDGDQDLFFVINPTFVEQRADVRLPGEVEPVLWDPSTGAESDVVPCRVENGKTLFALSLPPVGSTLVLPRPPGKGRVIEANIVVEEISDRQVRGYGRAREASVRLERGPDVIRLAATAPETPEPLVLDGDWEFSSEDPNALVLERWAAAPEGEGMSEEAFVGMDVDERGWVPMVPGAWAYQLAMEPARAYPIPVWFRVPFATDHLPRSARLILDGFAGSDIRLFVNGRRVKAEPERSPFDSQMRAVDITDLIVEGANVLAVRMTVESPTDGLLDRVKIIGDFGVGSDGAAYRITEPNHILQPESWTSQGYPFFSGRGAYRRSFRLPDTFGGCRLFLDVPMRDDALEVTVNGRPAGVRLWDPYRVEITDHVAAGENVIELRVANTLGNLLNGADRPSGLAGPPRVCAYRPFVLDIPVPRR